MKSPWSVAADLSERGEAFVAVTMVETRGHAPQDVGAKAIVTAEGIVAGTVGGGKVEAQAIREAQAWLTKESPAEDSPRLVKWNLQRDIGMSCGGEVNFLFEIHRPTAWRIVVFGAGHVAQALARVLINLRCHVTFIDPRPDWIGKLPTAGAVDMRTERVAQFVTRVEASPAEIVGTLDPRSYFVVMTQGHASDLPILRALFTHHPDAPYWGAIGSDVKALKLRKELAELGVSPEALARLHCPIGLKFGSNDPAEIALSVVAQLIQVRDALKLN